MKILKYWLCLLIGLFTLPGISQVYLSEGFEAGSKPEGWTEVGVSGNEPWRYRNGGHSPNDNNWQVPPEIIDITRNPPAAYEGTYNAIFFKQGDNNERTKLITPGLNMLGASAVELTFYLCQIPWTFEGATGWDILRVYYKVSAEDPWVLLHEYLDPVLEWEEQKLNLPNPSESYYVAFEGQTRWGYGTCIDDISIEETGSLPMYIGGIDFQQPFSNFVPSGSMDVPIMRVDFKVFGNTDSVLLDYIHFISLNSSDNDIISNSLKLYGTTTQSFDKLHPIGEPTSFSSGVASFTGLHHTLPAGQSYLWLTCDVEPDAGHSNILDVMVAANGIRANNLPYPDTDQSPDGYREIFETRYSENFEGTHNWTLTGEFEVGTPNGMGGIPGNPNPSEAFSGSRILGTDLSGLGANPYNYEPGLNEAAAYLATSPNVDALYYKNLNLFFNRYMNIEVWDQSAIEISTDDGYTWNPIWENSSYLSDFRWFQTQLPIPDAYSRTDRLRIRFKLGPTDGFNNYSGWNIDDIYLTGEFISKDVGVSQWIAPLSGSGHTDSEPVTVQIRNYGGAEIIDPVPVAYSFDGGANWTIDYMTQDIPVGGAVEFTFPSPADLSIPGFRPSVLAKTTLPGDQFTANNQFETEIYIVPTFVPPYMENFETGNGSWRTMGNGIWEHGDPNGNTIHTAASGTNAWATGLSDKYGNIIAQRDRVLFEDDFETEKGWTFTGEFERGVPSNMFQPYFANSGYYSIGTDLTGLGSQPHLYENGITEVTAFKASSPPMDASHYTSLKVRFASWITILNGDSIRLEVSSDNGSSWHPLWKNVEGEIWEFGFEERMIDVPEEYTSSTALRFRFSLFHTSAAGAVAEGWHIDDFSVTGDLVEDEPGYLNSPSFNLTGMARPVLMAKLWIDAEMDMDGVNLDYSLDDGATWTALSNTSGYDAYWHWYTGNPVTALGQDGWSGHSNGWMEVKHLLPPALLNQANVQFRFTFAADKTNNQFDGAAMDDFRMMEAPDDIDMLGILSPVSSCDLAAEQTFTLRMRNTGLTAIQAGDSLHFGYRVLHSGEIQTGEETLILTQAWPAATTRDIPMTAPFDFSLSGNYESTVYFKAYDPHFYSPVSNDTVTGFIQVNKPAVELGEDISTVRPDTVMLKAHSGVPGQTYLWQDGSTDSTFQVSTDGKYYVRVTNGIGCIASDTIQVLQLITDVGVKVYLGPQSACELASQLNLKVTVRNLGTDTIETGESIYVEGVINETESFSDQKVLTQRFRPGESFDFTYSRSFDFSTPGDYQMKLFTRMTGDMVPDNDTLFNTLQVYGYPDADLGPDTMVLGSEYSLSPAPGYFQYLWQDGSTAESYLVTKPGPGLYHVTVSDEHQCTSSDTVLLTLNVLDLALDKLLSPATSCALSESITISARVRNAGNQAIPSGETIQMGYRIDGGAIVLDQVILSQNLLPGRTFDFAFSNSETLQSGQWYDFTVFSDYEKDSKRVNDTIITSVGVFETPALDLGDEFQVIPGFEHTLDAGPGFVSYQWQDGSTNQTYTINKPGVGNYSVTVTDLNGCTAYDETEVMLAVPDIGILALRHPVTTCHLGNEERVEVVVKNFGNWDIESTAILSVSYSINGAEAISEALVLQDVFENGEELSFSFSHVEDFSEPGRYDIMAYTSYESDMVPSNDIVLVSVDHFGSPVVDIGKGTDTLLIYEPVTLSATTGYASYEWQDGSTESEYLITDPAAGWYLVIVTGENGCATHDSVYVAYDRPDLAIARIVSPVVSCETDGPGLVSMEIKNNGYYRISSAETLTITYSVDGGSSFIEQVHLDHELQLGESTVLTFTEPFDFSSPGSYQLQVSLIWSADQNMANNLLLGSVDTWENPDVTINEGADTLITSLPVTLEADPGFASYVWQDQSRGSAVQATRYGTFWVTVTDDHGCPGSDTVVLVSLTSAGSELAASGSVRIYPNPVKDRLHVALDLDVEKQVTIELYSIVNALIYREDVKRAMVTVRQIEVQDLPPGSYYLRITTDKTPHNFIVIVE
ncbi:MAG: T9SS type A sorting domain-containing protein [Bacteroidales bacterium]